MRIISQNRRMSVEFKGLVLVVAECGGFFGLYCGTLPEARLSDMLVLGVYTTQERAQEVFQDIHNAYCPVSIATFGLNDEAARYFIGSENTMQKILQMGDMDCSVTTYDNYAYYMPEA